MAGTVTLTHYALGAVRRIQADCVGDAADGTIPATVLPSFEGRLLAITTNPGATQPTDNYDITLVDDEGADRLQGVAANRDTANTESAPVVFSGSTVHPWVDGDETMTLTFANTSVNDAIVKVILYYTPNP